MSPSAAASVAAAPARRRRRRRAKFVWPAERIPTEVYDEITSYLPRHDVQNLRLVSKAMEKKVSAKYFRHVVVPFRPDTQLSAPSATEATLSEGMRILQSFGHHIFRFGISLEIDDDILSSPPVKPSQEAVTTFWGIYRWPHSSYHRFHDMENLETTADETMKMKDALLCLPQLRELALSCDAGWGYLRGPGPIPNLEPPKPDAIFRAGPALYQPPNPEPPSRSFAAAARPSVTSNEAADGPGSKYRILESMVMESGYSPAQAGEAVRVLLATEGVSLAAMDLGEPISVPPDADPDAEAYNALVNIPLPHPGPLPTEVYRPQPSGPLTRPQKELLLELEWVQRALVQSYIISIIDVSRSSSFSLHLTTLTLAKVPSCHLSMFCRHDFWTSLPALNDLALAVIADWRLVSNFAASEVVETSVSPVEAVAKVFSLLQNYVGRRPTIKRLQFEWLCGGEFAHCFHQRNRYVLPAPFCTPSTMALVGPGSRTEGLLSLPFVEDLTLKNCYFIPRIFKEVVRAMASASLHSLNLESVSLTGPPKDESNAVHLPQANPEVNPGFGNGPIIPAIGGVPPVIVPDAAATVDNGEQPSQEDLFPHSWVKFIDELKRRINRSGERSSQKNTSSTLLDNQTGDTDPRGEPRDVRRKHWKSGLKHLSFKSCGYVDVSASYVDSHAIMPGGAAVRGETVIFHSNYPPPFMQACGDPLAGRVINWLRTQEQIALCGDHAMKVGWADVYDDFVINVAKANGISVPGAGRFSGTVHMAS